jgi:5-methylcytosine-specific restriction endonuclease McrA
MTYSEQLKDPRWQKMRLEILQRDDFTCQECQDTTSTLHVHHRYYVSGRKAWEYPHFALQTLCEQCHSFHQEPWWTHTSDGEIIPEDWEILLMRAMEAQQQPKVES